MRISKSKYHKKFAGGFTKDWAPGKLTSCEDDFFRLVCHLEERFSYNEVQLKEKKQTNVLPACEKYLHPPIITHL